MSYDSDSLTPEELQMLKEATKARIKAIETKALIRLAMTDEENELLLRYNKMEVDPELSKLFTTLIIALSKSTNTDEPEGEK